MSSFEIAIVVIAVCVAAYQLYVSVYVARYAGFTNRQKILQVILIWLLPLIGAGIAHAILKSDKNKPKPHDRDFIPQEPQGF